MTTLTPKHNPSSKLFLNNPHPIWDKFRLDDTLHKDIFNSWIITRHSDAKAMLSNATRFQTVEVKRLASLARFSQSPNHSENLRKILFRILFFLNPPDHTRYHKWFRELFNPTYFQQLSPKIEHNIYKLVHSKLTKGPIDLIDELTVPALSNLIIEHILELPVSDTLMLHRWVYDMTHILDPFYGYGIFNKMMHSAEHLISYMNDVVTNRLHHPGDDFISAMIKKNRGPDTLSTEEIVSFALQLLVAGTDTTWRVGSSGLLSLLEYPDQAEHWRNNPALTASAVEELVRFNGALEAVPRVISEDFNFRNNDFKKGELIWIYLAAVNRDPAVFSNPQTLDLSRSPNPHLGFGQGIHYCIGAMLARQQLGHFFQALLPHLGRIRLLEPKEKLERVSHTSLGGYVHIPAEII